MIIHLYFDLFYALPGKKEASSRLSNDTASENKGENKTAKGKAALSKNANSVMNVRIKVRKSSCYNVFSMSIVWACDFY